MVIPIHDKNPTRRFPVVTYAILIINVVIYFFGPSFGDHGLAANVAGECKTDAFVQQWAAIPKELTENRQLPAEPVELVEGGRVVRCPAATFDKSPPLSALSSMFLHGGVLHLLGNLLFLYVFGNNVEDRLGKLRYLAFYLGCGYAATYGFSLFFSGSQQPLVGASGAIAGVLGAYLVLFPRARVWSLLTFLFFLPVRLPAWLVLGSWFLLQYLYTRGAGLSEATGTAYLAHVIGFLVGAALVWKLRRTARPRPIADPRWGPYARR